MIWMQGMFVRVGIALMMGLLPLAAWSQEAAVKLYDPEADAQAQLAEAVAQAREADQHVLVQVGGNWCSWCIRFHRFVEEDPALDSLVQANYVRVYVNYSRENQNLQAMAELGHPQRFGFPVFLVLDQAGNRLHTQNSWYLEAGKGYDRRKVEAFYLNWTKKAIEGN